MLPRRVALVLLSGLLVASSAMMTYSNTVLAAANITGVVYNDFNGNGVRDNAAGTTPNLAVDNGVQGVTIKAFDAAGNDCATTTSAGDGTYTLPMGSCDGAEFRVEFFDLPAGTEPASVGSENATTTQFVAGGGTADLGISQPGNFCQNDPLVMTSCLVFGERPSSPLANEAGIKGSPYSATGTEATTLSLGNSSEVGSIYGMAYSKANRTLYAAALTKRHADFGPEGIGAIYQSGPVPASGSGTLTPSLLVNIPNAGVDRHPVSTTNCDGRDGTSGGTAPVGEDCWTWDQFMFDAPGKSGLGDMEIYEDPTNSANDALLVVNLNDRNLYRVTDLGGTPSVEAPIAMPLALPGATQGCALADVRPFALDIADGVGYAGFTCSAESTDAATDLRAYVYTFDPADGTFGTSPILEAPLNYERGCADGCFPYIADWNPWTDALTIPPVIGTTPGDTNVVYPSPLLSDIEVGTNGSMTLGIRDRFGDQTSSSLGNNTTVGDTTEYRTTTGGELLRACLVGGAWTLESNGFCDGLGPGPAGKKSAEPSRGQGPGGNEFYNNEFYDDGSGNATGLDEIPNGSIASVPGFNEVISTVTEPLATSSFESGTHIYNTDTAALAGAHEIPYDDDHIFGKANALGDLEVLCDTAPLEIGNRIWFDANRNGVQDSDEPPIAGVTVSLYDSSNNLIDTVLTDSNGDYLFSNRALDENGDPIPDSDGKNYDVAGLTTNTDGFQLRLDNPDDYEDPDKLQDLFLTIPDSTISNGDGQNDSDATLLSSGDVPSATNPPTITFNTGPAGANNHTYDYGFVLEAVTPPPEPPEPSPSGGGSLANTGQSQLWFVLIGAAIIATGLGVLIPMRRHKTWTMSSPNG